MSLEIFRNGQDRHWEVTVQCSTSAATQLMRRAVDSDLWCVSANPEQCDTSKFALSQQMCGLNAPGTAAEVENQRAESSDQSAARLGLLREQLQIENQRIKIEQRRIELQRKELQLKKQRLGN